MLTFQFAPPAHHVRRPLHTNSPRLASPRLASPRSQSQLTDFSQISAHTSGVWRHSHPWSNPLSGIFIVTSLNDTSPLPAPEHLRLCLHLTNPCAKRKVLSLTKPKGKIYKTKSLGHYITRWHYSPQSSSCEWRVSLTPLQRIQLAIRDVSRKMLKWRSISNCWKKFIYLYSCVFNSPLYTYCKDTWKKSSSFGKSF